MIWRGPARSAVTARKVYYRRIRKEWRYPRYPDPDHYAYSPLHMTVDNLLGNGNQAAVNSGDSRIQRRT